MTKPRFCPCRYGCASPGEKDQNGIDGTDPFAAKPDPGLITLLLRARRLNATLAHAKASRLLHLPSGKGSAAPLSHASSASAIQGDPRWAAAGRFDGREAPRALPFCRFAWHDPADRARLCLSPIRI